MPNLKITFTIDGKTVDTINEALSGDLATVVTALNTLGLEPSLSGTGTLSGNNLVLSAVLSVAGKQFPLGGTDTIPLPSSLVTLIDILTAVNGGTPSVGVSVTES